MISSIWKVDFLVRFLFTTTDGEDRGDQDSGCHQAGGESREERHLLEGEVLPSRNPALGQDVPGHDLRGEDFELVERTELLTARNGEPVGRLAGLVVIGQFDVESSSLYELHYHQAGVGGARELNTFKV